MNQQLQVPQPPNPVSRNMEKDFTAVKRQTGALSTWCNEFTVWLKNQFLPPLVNQVNTQTQGSSTQASAGSVALSSAITHITGTAKITTLTAPSTFSGVAWLIADGAFSFGTGGNIAVSAGPFTVGETIRVTLDNAVWYPSHDFTYLTPTSSYTLPAATGSFQEIEVKNITAARLVVNPAGSDTIDSLPSWGLPLRASARFTDGAQGLWRVSPKSAGTHSVTQPVSSPYTLPHAIGSQDWHGVVNTTGGTLTVNVISGDYINPGLVGSVLVSNNSVSVLIDYATGLWVKLV